MENNRGSKSRCLLRFKDRISSSREIQEILKYGTIVKCPYFNYYIKINSKKRFNIIIKKFQKGTVRRNKIKRRVREIFRTNPIKGNYDTIILVKSNLITFKFFELKNQIHENIQFYIKDFYSE